MLLMSSELTRGVASSSAAPCSECEQHTGDGGPYPNYDHVHHVNPLPRARQAEHHIVVHGYAAEISGRLPHSWVFFGAIEPALVFGRAARMSYDVSSYGVFEAAREVRWDDSRGRDIATLYINSSGEGLDRADDETKAFRRWMRGCDPESSHFKPR